MNTNNCKTVLCLFNLSDTAPAPWLAAGYDVVSVDPQHDPFQPALPSEGGRHYKLSLTAEEYYEHWVSMPKELRLKFALVIAFPVCTDLAVSGALHWEAKRKRDPDFQVKAVESAKIATKFNAPYIIENPVGALSTQWRKPDIWCHPYEYGGWIPKDEAEHPRYPEYIAPCDAYPKKTGLWLGNGAHLPLQHVIEPEDGHSRQHLKLGGKSMKTKNIRSETPRGLALGIFLANCTFPEFKRYLSTNDIEF